MPKPTRTRNLHACYKIAGEGAVSTLPDPPDQYAIIEEVRSGARWVMPIRPLEKLDPEAWARRWVKQEFCGEFSLRGFSDNQLGDYTVHLRTDARPYDSFVCWTRGSFYVEGPP